MDRRTPCTLAAITAIAAFIVQPVHLPAAQYYIDSQSGDDRNSGTSSDSAWKTLDNLASYHTYRENNESFARETRCTDLSPGDIVNLARGAVFRSDHYDDGHGNPADSMPLRSMVQVFTIDDSGTASKPIVFRPYGPGNEPPTITRGTKAYSFKNGNVLSLRGARHIVIDGIRFTSEVSVDGQGASAGISLHPNGSSGSDNNVIKNCEFTRIGMGVDLIKGDRNLITKCDFHDLTMVENSYDYSRPGRSNNDNDYGATAVRIATGHNNEITYNQMINCRAPCLDYGTDGAVVELYATQRHGGQIHGTKIHHNYTKNCDIFIEMGGDNSRNTIADTQIAYNVSINNGKMFLGSHESSSHFASTFSNTVVDNNTIIDTETDFLNDAVGDPSNGWPTFSFGATPTAAKWTIRNNIIVSKRDPANPSNPDGGRKSVYAPFGNFTRSNNIYILMNSGVDIFQIPYTLHSAEQKVGNVHFVDEGNCDFRLNSNSPAVDAGVNLGYRHDLNGNSLVGAPDVGCYEYVSGTP